MKRLIIQIKLLAILLFTASCQFADPSFDYGRIVNGTYYNDFYNLEIPFPKDWHVLSEEQTKHSTDFAKSMFSGDDEQLRSGLKAYEVNTATLLYLTKYEMGATISLNPSFVILTESTRLFPGIKSGKDYLYHSKNLLSQSHLGYKFLSDDFELVQISNTDFYVAEISFNYFGIEVFQTMYVTTYKGFVLLFALTHSNFVEKMELENILLQATISNKNY